MPTLARRRWTPVDLDALAREAYGGASPSPLNDPLACARFVEGAAAALGADHTYGGYLERRDALWAGHYHDPAAMRHLGIDLNAPAGTPVAAAADCRVAAIVRDLDQAGGWGGLVLFELDAPYRGVRHLLYAHLAHDGLPEVGARLALGDRVGRIGTAAENGGWYPHLHLQCLSEAWVGAGFPSGLDGYGPNAIEDRPDMPDPTGLAFG